MRSPRDGLLGKTYKSGPGPKSGPRGISGPAHDEGRLQCLGEWAVLVRGGVSQQKKPVDALWGEGEKAGGGIRPKPSDKGRHLIGGAGGRRQGQLVKPGELVAVIQWSGRAVSEDGAPKRGEVRDGLDRGTDTGRG